MIKNTTYTYQGANQDISRSKHRPEFYFEAQHIRILASDGQTTGSVVNEKGNTLVATIPSVVINTTTNKITYGTKTLSYENNNEIDEQVNAGDLPASSSSQQIIAHVNTRDGVVLFTTDGLGMDCIWLLDDVLGGTYDLQLLYVRNLGFDINYPIQAVFNYENENIQKVYWVDGIHQVRFLNIKYDSIEDNEPLIELDSSTFNFVGTIDFSQPTVLDVVGGGIHTAGMIQYAYNLYRLNGSQTKLSPLSELVPLGKGINLGGGAVNEVVGQSPIVQISDIDQSYTHIKLYAIKYTSYNQSPSINLIDDRTIDGNTTITITDDGTSIEPVTLSELLFLGSDPVIPKHIESKDNRLFLANIQDRSFDITQADLDCRAYSFNSGGNCTIYDNVTLTGSMPTGDALVVSSSTYAVPIKHDAVNLNYDIYKYQANGTTLGGEGKYIKYQIVQKTSGQLTDNVNTYRFLKDREIYRIGVIFYNRLGQESLPKWVADFKAPTSNLQGSYNTLLVTLKSEFYTWLNTFTFESEDDKPVGYKVIRADRTLTDRTIICQGILSTMMVNSPRDTEGAPLYSLNEKRSDSKVQKKMPNILVRTFQDISPLKANSHLQAMQFGSTGGTSNPLTEIQYDTSERKADTYQYTAMFQMYSPEIMFDSASVNSSTQFQVVGGLINTENSYWGQERKISNKVVDVEGKSYNKLSPHAAGGTNVNINGTVTNLMDRGLISDTNGSNADQNVEFNQWYRKFSGLAASGSKPRYNIYGTPEITERGQGNTTYNNNSKYVYTNSFEGFLSDGEDEFSDDGQLDRAIISLNSYGAKCITFIADDGSNTDVEPHLRPLIEQIYTAAGIANTATVLLTEFVRPANDVYVGGIYGGNSYEDKKRTTYLQVGDYNDIATTSVQIDSPGDTYVQEFKFLRVSKTDTEVYSAGINQITELVSATLETTVDLKNRNDTSISQWESRFQPTYDEYHEYNRVYSQQPSLVQNTDVDFTFKRIKNYDTRIQSTKLKIPNETVDSWTDILQNETMDLDGKYGPINAIVAYKNDAVFTFQDEAIAQIAINPRVQVQGNDGIAIELGTGGILYDYNYITTKSGSINKWSVLKAKKGVYYYDALNKSIGRIPDFTQSFLTDIKGMHSFFSNNFDYNKLKVDNPLLGQGVVFGYDNYNNDVFFTLHQGTKSFTWCYNELIDQFIDLKTYTPSFYINKGERLIMIESGLNSLYEAYTGTYNDFFGVEQPSYVILQANPEPFRDCVFNNILYKSEAYNGTVDVPYITLNKIQAYNEYQDTGLIEFTSKNLRRKFREWRAQIPRQLNSRDRIRNPWIFLKLQFDNPNGYKLVLHDMTVFYTVY